MQQTIKVLNEEELKANVCAVSSLCEDGKHIIIWDFDGEIKNESYLYKIENSLKSIANVFDLTDIYIFSSRNGFNAVCLNKLDFNLIYSIKDATAFDDRKHLEHGLISSAWKLRIGEDKKYISFINNPNKVHISSNAHRIFFNKLFKMNIKKDKSFDNSKNFLVESYWCWKETYHAK